MADEVEANPHLVFESDFGEIPLAVDGRLDQETLFPESVRGRRSGRMAHA
jgi:hypothetical protein